jgi:hypothetical protein
MKIQVDYNEDMKNVFMTDIDTGFNAVYDAVSDSSLVNAFKMFIKDANEYPYTIEPVYNEEGNYVYDQMVMKETLNGK